MKQFSKRLFGFCKKEVEEEVTRLEGTLADAQKELAEHKSTIEELKKNVRRYQDRERFLSEIMIDTKEMSKKSLEESRESAIKVSQEILEDTHQRLSQAEETFEKVSELKNHYAQYEQRLKSELKAVLEDYLERVEQIDLVQSHTEQRRLETEMTRVKEEVSAAKNIITFPQYEIPELEDDIPIYTVE